MKAQVNLGQILQGGLAALVGWLFKTVNDLQQEVATLKAQVAAYQDSISGFNQNLLAIRALIYLTSLGKYGIQKVANLCICKTQYLITEIIKIDGFSIPFQKNILFEFLVTTTYSIDRIIQKASNENIYLNKIKYNNNMFIQIAVTEKRTKSELDKLIIFLKNYNE